MSEHSLLYTKSPSMWFHFLSVEKKVTAKWSKRPATVKQFALSWYFLNLDCLAGYFSAVILRYQVFLPFQEAQNGHWFLYQTVAVYCNVPATWRNWGRGTSALFLTTFSFTFGCRKVRIVCLKLWPQKSKKLCQFCVKIKSKTFSAAATSSSAPRDKYLGTADNCSAQTAYSCLLSVEPPDFLRWGRSLARSTGSSLSTAAVTIPVSAESLIHGVFLKLFFKIPFHSLRMEL